MVDAIASQSDVKCERKLEIDSELFDRVHPNAREHRALLVPEYHLRGICAAGTARRRRSEVRRVVPRAWSELEPLITVEVEGSEVFRTDVIADVGRSQQHHERSSARRWEKHLPTV